MKSQSIRLKSYSILITCLTCLILSIIVFQGRYFQNWLYSADTLHKVLVIIAWFVLFAFYGVCLSNLLKSNEKQKSYLFLFGIQFLAFAVYVISTYCLATYIIATVSSILSLIFAFLLAIKLFKNKQYALMFLLILIIIYYLYCVFFSMIFCSLEYGTWKD